MSTAEEILKTDPIVRKVYAHFNLQNLRLSILVDREVYIARASKDLDIPEDTVRKTVNFLQDSGLVETYLGKSKTAKKMLDNL